VPLARDDRGLGGQGSLRDYTGNRTELRGIHDSPVEFGAIEFGPAGFGYASGDDRDVRTTAGDYVTGPERMIRYAASLSARAGTARWSGSRPAMSSSDELLDAVSAVGGGRESGTDLGGAGQPDPAELRPVRVAMLASCATGPFEHLLRASLVSAGTWPALVRSGRGAFEPTLTTGTLAADDPDVVVCLLDERYFLPRDWSPVGPAGLAEQLEARLADLRGLVLANLRRSTAAFVLHTVPLPAELRETVISWQTPSAARRAWHRLNAAILALADEDSRIAVVDLAGELADARLRGGDEPPHSDADLAYPDGALLTLARHVARVIQARLGPLRTDFFAGYASPEEYLHALGTRVLARPVTAFEVARVAQLAARTNQFNLTGIRFDDGATAAMSADPGYLVVSFAVSDRFGDEGIVGAAWIECRSRVWWVLNLVVHSRVLGRGVEYAMADWIVRRAAAVGAAALAGRYVPAGRNAVAEGFWEKAGFTPAGEDGVFTVAPGAAPTCLPTWIAYADELTAGHE
jgi:GNAT superfamily N-acetyltransferase